MVDERIIIVGGGLMGLLTARELLLADRRVELYERGPIGRESSWAGGGILSSLHPWDLPVALEPLVAWSRRHYPLLAEELGQATGIDPEWQPSGLLVLSEAEIEAALAWLRRGDEQGRLLEAEALAECEPALNPGRRRAVHLPDVAQVRNPRLLRALVADLEARGLVCHAHAEVAELLYEDGRITGIRTGAGVQPAATVVVCSGAWTHQLLGGIVASADIVPVRGQMLLYHVAPGLLRHILLDGDRYLIPRRDGHILVGSTVEYAGFDKSVTLEAAKALQAEAEALLPALVNERPTAHWAGLRPGRAEGVPMLGPVPSVTGLYVNAGHYRNGVLLGPASARLVADEILGRPTFCDPVPYLPH